MGQKVTLALLQNTSLVLATTAIKGAHKNTNSVQKTGLFVPQRDGRQTPRMLKCMENLNLGQRDPQHCFRAQDNFYRDPLPEVTSDFPCIRSRCRSNFRGSRPVVIKRSNLQSAVQRRFLQSSVCYPKERGLTPSSDRPWCPQQVCFEPSLSDGKYSLFENVTVKRRLYDKYRFKGRIPLHPLQSILSLRGFSALCGIPQSTSSKFYHSAFVRPRGYSPS